MMISVCDYILVFFVFLFSPLPDTIDMTNIKAYVEMQRQILNRSNIYIDDGQQITSSSNNMTVYLFSPGIKSELNKSEKCSDKLELIEETFHPTFVVVIITNITYCGINTFSLFETILDEIPEIPTTIPVCLRTTYIYMFTNLKCTLPPTSDRDDVLTTWQKRIMHFVDATEASVVFKWIGSETDYSKSDCKFDLIDRYVDMNVVSDTFTLREGIRIDSLWELYAQRSSLYYLVVVASNVALLLFIYGLIYMGKLIRRQSIVRNLSLIRVRSAATAARHAAGQRLAALNEQFLGKGLSRNGDDKWELRSENVMIFRNDLLGSGAFANVYRGELSLGAEETNEVANPRLAYFFSNTSAMERGKRCINVAIKTPRNAANARNRDEFWREVQLMKTIGIHPHILNLIGYMLFAFKIHKISEVMTDSDDKIATEVEGKTDGNVVAEILWENDSLDEGVLDLSKDNDCNKNYSNDELKKVTTKTKIDPLDEEDINGDENSSVSSRHSSIVFFEQQSDLTKNSKIPKALQEALNEFGFSDESILKCHSLDERANANTVTWGDSIQLDDDVNKKQSEDSDTLSTLEKVRINSERITEANQLSAIASEQNSYAPSPACIAPLLVLEFCEAGDLLHLLRANRESLLYTASQLQKEISVDVTNDVENARHTLSAVTYNKNFNRQSLPKVQLELRHLFSFAWQISDAAMYLASKNFVHRDIAARNVLVTGDVVAKLSDFGLCRHNASGEDYHIEGNNKLPVKWMAIEALSACRFNEKTDVWSFGVLLYEIFSAGTTPYADIKIEDMVTYLKKGNRLNRPDLCSDSIYDLMSHCWNVNPDERLSFKEVRRKLGSELKWADDLYGYIEFYSSASTSSIRAAEDANNQKISGAATTGNTDKIANS